MDNLQINDDNTVSSGCTKETSATFIKLSEYIDSALPDDNQDDDDAKTMITHMVADDRSEIPNDDENTEPGDNTTKVATPSICDDGSVDLVYNGLEAVARGPLSVASSKSTSSRSASSRSTTKSSRNKNKTPAQRSSPKTSKPKTGAFSKDMSLDLVLERLSRKEPEVALPPKAAWESKVKFLANQIDLERDNGMKLTDIEAMLERKKIRAKKDTEQAKWKSRVRDLEGLLEEKKKVKEEKLRKLAIILEALKKEKKEMKKYEKPNGGGDGGRWAAKAHDVATPNVRTAAPRKSMFSSLRGKK